MPGKWVVQANALLSRYSKQVGRNLRDYGVTRTVSKVAGSLSSVLFYTRAYTLYRAVLGRLNLACGPRNGFEYRFLALDEADYFLQIKNMEEWLEEPLENILQEGGKCMVALDGKQVAGFNLVSFKEIHLPVIAYRRKLRPKCAYSEQITVSPAYRGRNLGATMRTELFRALHSEGVRVIYGGTDVYNSANQALCRKVGLKGIVDIRHIRVLGFKMKLIRRRH